LLQNEESPACLKEQMGHHSIEVAMDIYGHLIPGANRNAVDRLDDPATGRNPRATNGLCYDGYCCNSLTPKYAREDSNL
jgi:hypothetical protein